MENKSHVLSSEYDKLIRMDEQIPIREISENDIHLKNIYEELKNNTNVKESAKLLLEIINDSDYLLNIMIIGDMYTNKSNFINALLNRDLMPGELNGMSYVNSVIRYGEEEELIAYFLDGQIANFSVDQIYLFAISDTFSSQIMRDGLDYIDIRINHPLLKNLSLFDTSSYKKSVFLRENFVKRCQVAIWLNNSRFRGLPSEQRTLIELEKQHKKLLFITDKTENAPIVFEQSKDFNHVEKLPFSIDELTEGQLTNKRELLVRSGLEELVSFFSKSNLNYTEYDELIDNRVIKWIKRFTMEMKNLISRDPYLEAYQTLKNTLENEQSIFNKNKEAEGQLVSLEKEFTMIRQKYNEIETGYQLQEFLDTNKLVENKGISNFVVANKEYHEAVLAYRRKNTKDVEAQKQLEKLYQRVSKAFNDTKQLIFNEIQRIFISLEQKMLDIHLAAEYQLLKIDSAKNRLLAFDSLVRAQEHIISYLKNKNQMDMMTSLKEVKMNYKRLIDNYNAKQDRFNLSTINRENNRHSVYKDILEKIDLQLAIE